MIALRSVTLSLGDRRIVDDITLTIEPGEFVCVYGTGGSGTSSLLGLLLALRKPSAGSVEVDGADLHALPPLLLQLYRRRVGVVFQDLRLLPGRTIAENIAVSMEANGASEEAIDLRVRGLLASLGITDRAGAFPTACSWSEQALIAFARGIAHRPSILLIDNLFGYLDAAQASLVMEHVRKLRAQGTTIVLATHDPAFADACGARGLTLQEGKIVDRSAVQEDTLVEAMPRHGAASIPVAPEGFEKDAIVQIAEVEPPVLPRATATASMKEQKVSVRQPPVSRVPLQGRYVPKTHPRKSPRAPRITSLS